MTTRSGREYSVFVQTMSGDELSDMNNDGRQAEPGLTQMLQALLADREDYKGNSAVRQTSAAGGQGLYTPGMVEGTPVESIVLDIGCSRTLVRSNLVPQDKVLEGESVAIRCAHGDTVLYPLALVHREINGHHLDVEAALSETLPMPVLLGTDVPQLQDFIGQAFFREKSTTGDRRCVCSHYKSSIFEANRTRGNARPCR